ncbi:hypothetical protein LINGRAHAP2_LOCUS13690 [Linum grandiflorum]
MLFLFCSIRNCTNTIGRLT